MSLPYKKENIPFAKKTPQRYDTSGKKAVVLLSESLFSTIPAAKAIGAYIVDFYCDEAKLAIEIDGSQHFEPEEVRSDEQRTKDLNRAGVEVLRFNNRDVNLEFRNVCDRIDKAIRQRMEKAYDEF